MEYKIYSKFNKGLFVNLIKGIKTIDKPLNESQVKEAKEVGIELLKRSSSANYNLYKFTKCGHTAFLQPTHVRRNNIDCKTCQLEKMVDLAHISNDQLLFRVKSDAYKILRKCGHIVESFSCSMKNQRLQCRLCFEESLKERADENNYTYLGAEGSGYRKIKFKSCGHYKSVHFSQINKGNVVCRECQDIGYRKKAKENGLHLIERTKNMYAVYKLPCGCNKELRIDHASDGSWICDIHDDSHYSKPSMLYLLEIEKDGFSWLKLGFAKNLEIRTANYGLKSSTIKYVKTIPFETGRKAIIFEKALHSELKESKLSKHVMKNYHTNNGHTECYPVHMKDLIVSKMDSSLQ